MDGGQSDNYVLLEDKDECLEYGPNLGRGRNRPQMTIIKKKYIS